MLDAASSLFLGKRAFQAHKGDVFMGPRAGLAMMKTKKIMSSRDSKADRPTIESTA